jgi:hypothetical protein
VSAKWAGHPAPTGLSMPETVSEKQVGQALKGGLRQQTPQHGQQPGRLPDRIAQAWYRFRLKQHVCCTRNPFFTSKRSCALWGSIGRY